ncbi:cytochrome b [Algimonas ampicilliniresistens]|jgi:quinol-cytochrome oxidoreductase complex cytochrome b subunit|uniref:Cytochrome b n=1 Tax=Algimonas ampicilliniresistens TaxID=1298735 RepID=A0ABQ5V6W4_9PROT|nr:cytochrome b N-terminal domain-containing protein [Algimonas ampicilliniresistens]GLQ22311.1 cytochrome b [Algimonas ampicilliniresistens]
MSGHSTYEPKWAAARWMDQRLPIVRMGADFIMMPTPRNLNYWWTFGGILLLCLVIQIVTGVILGMHYVAHVDHAFDSVQRIRRDVPYGWLMQSTHAVGASMFFLAVYMHMFRGLYYGSYKAPREVLWIIGCLIYLVMMATAFLGYTLPWGQMSFWGATVITGFFGAVPVVGESLQQWLLGGYAVDNATLNRFYSLHYLLPFIIAALSGLHVWALHVTGSSNPIGVSNKVKTDTLPFHPYFTVKDMFAVAVFLMIFAFFLFYLPDALGHADNYIKADPLKTPPHIVPEWYFLPFYAILRAVPDKLAGILLMIGAIAVLFVLPWLDTSKVRSMRFRPIARWFFFIFVFFCFILGWCGAETPDDEAFLGLSFYRLSQISTLYYFAYFLVILPILGLIEDPKERPASITQSILDYGDKPEPEKVLAPAE